MSDPLLYTAATSSQHSPSYYRITSPHGGSYVEANVEPVCVPHSNVPDITKSSPKGLNSLISVYADTTAFDTPTTPPQAPQGQSHRTLGLSGPGRKRNRSETKEKDEDEAGEEYLAQQELTHSLYTNDISMLNALPPTSPSPASLAAYFTASGNVRPPEVNAAAHRRGRARIHARIHVTEIRKETQSSLTVSWDLNEQVTHHQVFIKATECQHILHPAIPLYTNTPPSPHNSHPPQKLRHALCPVCIATRTIHIIEKLNQQILARGGTRASKRADSAAHKDIQSKRTRLRKYLFNNLSTWETWTELERKFDRENHRVPKNLQLQTARKAWSYMKRNEKKYINAVGEIEEADMGSYIPSKHARKYYEDHPKKKVKIDEMAVILDEEAKGPMKAREHKMVHREPKDTRRNYRFDRSKIRCYVPGRWAQDGGPENTSFCIDEAYHPEYEPPCQRVKHKKPLFHFQEDEIEEREMRLEEERRKRKRAAPMGAVASLAVAFVAARSIAEGTIGDVRNWFAWRLGKK